MRQGTIAGTIRRLFFSFRSQAIASFPKLVKNSLFFFFMSTVCWPHDFEPESEDCFPLLKKGEMINKISESGVTFPHSKASVTPDDLAITNWFSRDSSTSVPSNLSSSDVHVMYLCIPVAAMGTSLNWGNGEKDRKSKSTRSSSTLNWAVPPIFRLD